MPMFGKSLPIFSVLFFVCIELSYHGVKPYDVYHRPYTKATTRNVVPASTASKDVDYDTILMDNYLRNYLTGPVNDYFIFMTHDVISCYVGPPPKGHPEEFNAGNVTGRIRAWGMFDIQSGTHCELNAVHNWGMMALFSCPQPGVYQAYAYESNLTKMPMEGPLLMKSGHSYPTLAWLTKTQKEQFDLLEGPTKGPQRIQIFNEGGVYRVPLDRMQRIMSETSVVKSDPVEVKSSHYCYIWMYSLTETARLGYVDNEVVPYMALGANNGANIEFELLIWVAEPSAVLAQEAGNDGDKPIISDYSELITQRFSDIGLFPCLRQAHSVVEIVSEIVYISQTDPENELDRSPYWKAKLRIHTDRLISTLSDVSFSIASRQYTGSMNCFVADTRVFLNLRQFTFVRQAQLGINSINLEISNIWPQTKKHVQHQFKHIYGHGVQYIGFEWSKFYQPSTTRTDMTVFTNPCIAQEFAFSVGGSLYVAEGFLAKGQIQTTKVVLPGFKNPDGFASSPEEYREYLRMYDVAFTPTHAAFLHLDGNVMLHSTSAARKGIANIESTQKYRPTGFVQRRWCPRTSTPKYTSMKITIFSRQGNIIVLQIYPIEGNIRMWVTPPSSSCKTEGIGFTEKYRPPEFIINETDIHYNEYAAVKRTNHITGLPEPPLPPRPAPPPSPPKQRDEEFTFLISDKTLGSGKDPHFPPTLLDPATHTIGDHLEHYNDAVIYVLEKDMANMQKVLEESGITVRNPISDIALHTVEYAAVEQQFIVAVKVVAKEISNSFAGPGVAHPFEMILTSMIVTNYPFRLKIDRDHREPDDELNTIIPFPGVILVRSKPFIVPVAKSRDKDEEKEHSEKLIGRTEVEFIPEVFPMSTSIPSYVINFGDVLVYTSLEGRFARPLHYYTWEAVNKNAQLNLMKPPPLIFNQSTISFKKESRLHDTLVTEQGIISVLWRKKNRHIVQDHDKCLVTEDGDTQTAAIGSVLSLEGLREVKPFFRNDNVFQRTTPDGEIIYGTFDTKPHSQFQSCHQQPYNITKDQSELCIQQAKRKPEGVPDHPGVCSKDERAPCIDPGYVPHCPEPGAPTLPEAMPCLRLNKLNCSRYVEDYVKPTISPGWEDKCIQLANDVSGCLPKHMPRETLRSANILGTPFLSYLLGSLHTVNSLHPEAPVPPPTSIDPAASLDDDPHANKQIFCPFINFEVYNTDFDFAEVGYQTRVTGEISYFGNSIPTEADLKIEFDRKMGVVVDISSSVEEERGLTTVRKTVDIRFEMTDFAFGELLEIDESTRNDIVQRQLDFDDLRATEKSSVFSITLRPNVINMRCKNSDYFKTIQFNVGCNTFSTIRLLSEATPFKRINWTEALDESSQFKWIRDTTNWTLKIPIEHIFFRQIRDNVFKCSNKTGHCEIPYFHLFKNEIYTISYRDFFAPSFEQFMTVSSRRVKGNSVLYDMLGSQNFNWTTDKLKAGCFGIANKWYDKLLATTKNIGTSSLEHENVYMYYQDCFDVESHKGQRELPLYLMSHAYHLHNFTNKNMIKFRRQRNHIFIFRAVIINTYFNRFTYCKLLDTFFMVRVTGIPIPRQELALWHYLLIFLSVSLGFLISYWFFYKFYAWKLDLGVVQAEMEQAKIDTEINAYQNRKFRKTNEFSRKSFASSAPSGIENNRPLDSQNLQNRTATKHSVQDFEALKKQRRSMHQDGAQ